MNNKNKTNINWYPGHMAKTKRQIKEDLKLIDLVVELLDARIPISSRNPDIEEITKGKKKIIVLNKSDLAEEKENQRWNTVIMKSRQEVRCLRFWGINGCRITEGILTICISIIIWKLVFAIMGKAQLPLKKTYPLMATCLL